MSVRRKILAPLMVLLVLISSTSFTVNLHYCMGTLQNVALFFAVEQCGNTETAGHDPHDEHSCCQKSCCEDQSIMVEGQGEKTATNAFTVKPPDASMILFYLADTYLYTSTNFHTYTFKEYSPPLIELSLSEFTQSFLL